jgi:CDP-glycerol glycerophosphotransferase (TagB/SpsB family)
MLKVSFIYLLSGILGVIDLIFFSKKKDIIFHGYKGIPSGNNLALYDFIKSEKSLKCNLYWTGYIKNFTSINSIYSRETPQRNASLIAHIRYLFFLMRFKVIIVESAGDLSFYLRFLSNRFRLKVLLVHGFCLKGCGVLAPNLNKEQKKIWSQVGESFNLISVSSQLEKYLLSSTFNASPDNCVVMGPQRPMGIKVHNESERSEARSLIGTTYNINLDNDQKIIFYTPTHRDHNPGLNRPILFGFDSYAELNKELIKSNTILFLREHGNSSEDTDIIMSNIIDTSKSEKIDFHLLYAGIDGLVTDYSGIFLEYLCSDIKIGFWQYDIGTYREARGFSISENIFKTGSQINNPTNFIDFISLISVSKEVRVLREFWHKLLYENPTEESLRLTVNEIKRRAKIVD